MLVRFEKLSSWRAQDLSIECCSVLVEPIIVLVELVAAISWHGKRMVLPNQPLLRIVHILVRLKMLNGGSVRTALLRTKSCSWRTVSKWCGSMMCTKSSPKPNSSMIGHERILRMSLQYFPTAGCSSTRSNRAKRRGIDGQNTSTLPLRKPLQMLIPGRMSCLDTMLPKRTFLSNTRACACLFLSNSRMDGLHLPDARVDGLSIICP